MSKAQWRYSNGDDEGRAWRESPRIFAVYVDFQEQTGAPWRRIHVATSAWMQDKLDSTNVLSPTSQFFAIPATLVLPDLRGTQLEEALAEVLREGGLLAYSEAVG
jgi:hypothetical protein